MKPQELARALKRDLQRRGAADTGLPRWASQTLPGGQTPAPLEADEQLERLRRAIEALDGRLESALSDLKGARKKEFGALEPRQRKATRAAARELRERLKDLEKLLD